MCIKILYVHLGDWHITWISVCTHTSLAYFSASVPVIQSDHVTFACEFVCVCMVSLCPKNNKPQRTKQPLPRLHPHTRKSRWQNRWSVAHLSLHHPYLFSVGWLWLVLAFSLCTSLMPGSSTFPSHHAGQVQIPRNTARNSNFSKTLKNQLKLKKQTTKLSRFV